MSASITVTTAAAGNLRTSVDLEGATEKEIARIKLMLNLLLKEISE